MDALRTVFDDWEQVLAAPLPPDLRTPYREAIVKFRYWLRQTGKTPDLAPSPDSLLLLVFGAVHLPLLLSINWSDFRIENTYDEFMKIKVNEFKVVVPKPAGNGSGDNEGYMVSDNLLTIPETTLNQYAIIETLPNGVQGVDECCSRIHVGGNNWLVLGDIRAACFTNNIVEAHY